MNNWHQKVKNLNRPFTSIPVVRFDLGIVQIPVEMTESFVMLKPGHRILRITEHKDMSCAR